MGTVSPGGRCVNRRDDDYKPRLLFPKVPLFAHSIGFGEPRCDFVIDFLGTLESKGVKMISGRERFDPAKAGVFQTARQHDVAINPVLADNERGETHADLKGDARLLGKHDDWSVAFSDAAQFVKNRADSCGFAGEMGSKCVTAARMRLISIRELSPALRATPQRRARLQLQR